MTIHTLERKQVIPLPLKDVFPFFASPENLGAITPRWLKFRMITPPPIRMMAGAEIEYTISWLGIPLHWKTLIEEYDPPHRFVDLQVRGPYSLWRHTHSFREVAQRTEMRDHIEYALPFGLLGNLAHTFGVRNQIKGIFDHRERFLAAHFTGNS